MFCNVVSTSLELKVCFVAVAVAVVAAVFFFLIPAELNFPPTKRPSLGNVDGQKRRERSQRDGVSELAFPG